MNATIKSVATVEKRYFHWKLPGLAVARCGGNGSVHIIDTRSHQGLPRLNRAQTRGAKDLEHLLLTGERWV